MCIEHICLGKFLGRAGTVLSEDESVDVREVGMLLDEIGVVLGRCSLSHNLSKPEMALAYRA